MSEIDINSLQPANNNTNTNDPITPKASEGFFSSLMTDMGDWFGTWEDYSIAAEDGHQRSQSWDETSDVWNSSKFTADGTIQKYIDEINKYEKRGGEIKLEKYEEWSDAYDEYDKDHNAMTSFILATMNKGIDGLGQVMVQSMASYAKKEVIARGIAGGTMGLLGGPKGVMAGMFGSMGAATETMITFTELLKEDLIANGLGFDVEGISSLRDDHPDVWQSIQNRALARGVTIGAVEGISTLVGVKGSGNFAKSILKGMGTGISGKLAAGVGGSLVAGAAETGGGMIGEVLGSEVAGQEYTTKDVLVEGFANLATAPTTAAMGAGSQILNAPKYRINGGGVSFSKFKKYTDSMTDLEIAQTDIDVVNDEQLAEKLYKRQQKAIVNSQLDTRITDVKAREQLTDLEVELMDLKNNETESAAIKRKDIKTKIAELNSEFAVGEADASLTKDKVDVREARSERDIARAERLGERLNLKVERVNTGNYKQRFLEEGGVESQFDGTGIGNVVNGKILLNEDAIKQGGYFNVGAHEILHGVIGDSFKGMDIDAKVKLTADFTSILTEDQRNFIKLRLFDDYGIDTKEDMFSEQGLRSWVDRDNLGEEIFTIFSEGILDGEIGYDETVFDKLKNTVQELLRKVGINKEFENGRQVYNFLKDYNKNTRVGEVSKRTEKFAAKDKTSDKVNYRKNYDEDYGYDDNFDERIDAENDMDSDMDETDIKAKKKYEKTKRDTKLNKIGERYTKAQWDESGYKESMAEWYEDVEAIIKNNISSELRALPNFSESDFISESFVGLSRHIKNFNINMKKTDEGFGLSGWIRGQVSNKIGDVLKSKKATTDTFTADTSAEQFKELEATDVESMDESEDLSIGAQQKKKALAERRESKGLEADVEYSKTRRKLKFGDTEGISPSFVRAIKSAVGKVLSTNKIDPKDKSYKDKLNKGFLTELKNEFQNRFGKAADFKVFLTENRETIVDALPTATWVQIERNVPVEDRIFTKFLRKLTKQADIQEAIDQGLIPAAYKNKESVDLYIKIMPAEDAFLEFYNPPAQVYSEKKQAMVRSGLKGTRKDTLAEQLGAEIGFDATMEVLTDEDVQERMSLANGQPFDASVIAKAIERGADVRFNKRSEKITSGMVREVSSLLNSIETKTAKFSDVVLLGKDKKGKTTYSLVKPITKKFAKSGYYSTKDSAAMAEIVSKVFFSNKYGSIQNKTTYNKVLKKLVEHKNSNSKKALQAYRVHEQLFINIIGDAVKFDPTLNVNRYIEEGGKGDVYISKGKIHVGIEIKMHEAYGVSQTLNWSISKKGIKFESTNPNKVDTAAEKRLQDMTAESLQDISDLMEDAGFGAIKGMEINQEQKDFMDTYFLKTFLTNVTNTTPEYVAAHYGDKVMGEGFIQVGDKYYRLKTKNARINKLTNDIVKELGIDVPYFDSKDGSIPLVIKAQTVALKGTPGKYKLNFRVMPKISSDALVDSKANLLNETFAKKFGKATSKILVNYNKKTKAQNLAKAIRNTTKPGYNTNPRGMSAFDFDETLIIDGENFIIATKGDDTVKISSGDWPIVGPKYTKDGYSFNFDDFVNVRGGVDGPLLKKFKSRLKRYGAANTFVLTARPQEAAPAIHGWLKSKGLEIPMENITGLASSLGESKAEWMLEKFAEGYNDMYFVDDALPNYEAVKDAMDQLDIKSNVQLAKVMFSKRKYNSSQDPYSFVDFKTVPKEIVNSKSYKKWTKSLEGIKLFHGTVINPSDISKRGTNHSLNWFVVGGNNNEQAISLAKDIERDFDGEPENSVLSIDASKLAGRILPDSDYIGPSDAMGVSSEFAGKIQALEDKYKASTRVQSMIQIPAMYAEFLDIVTEYNPMSGYSQTLFDKNGKLSVNTAVVVIGGLKPNELKVESDAKVNYSRRKNTPIFKARMTKARPDLNASQIDNIVGSVFDFTESDAVPIKKRNKFENLAYNYIENGFVILPEDGYKVIEAERLAAIKKIDPMSVSNPNEIIEKYAKTVKGAKTNPNTVKEFSNKKDLGNGVVTYDVEQTKEGQLAVRKVIDTHFGEKSNPWCLAARSERAEQSYAEFDNREQANIKARELESQGYDVEVSTLVDGTYEVYGDLMIEPNSPRVLDEAFIPWKNYQRGGKGYQIVFTDGKLSHFRDGSGQYWDRMDDNSGYISKKLNSLMLDDGFTQKRELNVNTGKEVLLERTKITGNKQDGVYTETVIDPRDNISRTKESEYKDGERLSVKEITKRPDGVQQIVLGGVLDIETIYPEGFDNTGVKYTEIGKIMKKSSKQTGLDLYIKNPTSIRTFEKPGTNADVKVVKGTVDGKEITLEVEITIVETSNEVLSKRFEDRTDSIKVNGKTVYTAPKVNFSKRSKAEQTVLNALDIKGEAQTNKVNFNKKIQASTKDLIGESSNLDSRRINEMIERGTGIDADTEVSKAAATRKGANTGKFRIFIPPGAEDFQGLLYQMLGDNKQGEADMAFIKEALLDPLNRGERAVATKKQQIIGGYKEIKRKHYKAHGKLGKIIPGTVYTYGHAVRAQIWNEMGVEIPGIDATEQAFFIDTVLSDPELSDYAMDLEDIFHGDYPLPKDSWIGGTVANDMIDATLKTNRKDLLHEFISNADNIFSPANLNKMESVYGTPWRVAMEDMLYRVKNGTNRSVGSDGSAGKWLNWINASVGSIMFLNTRSAALQLLSTVNYVNHGDNNIFAAGKAFANQSQYWADFGTLWNSDFLKQRRSGLQTDISQAEIASAVAGAKNKASAAINYLLKKGFLPTQIADSFAISSGGATFYRNRMKTYVKSGMTEVDAQAAAFSDFQELTEEAQQSSRPDRISMQQASPLGRLILAFQNTPMQYARIIKKSMMDIQAGRGDIKTHMSRIIWYGGIQSAIFGALQTGLFMQLFDDDEETEKMTDAQREKKEQKDALALDRTIEMMSSSIINGSGFRGRVISTIYNTVSKFSDEREKTFGSNPNSVLLQALSISPPIGSKARKLSKAASNVYWNEGAIEDMSMSNPDHPYYKSLALTAEAGLNIPLDRAWNKLQNLRAVLDAENTRLQKFMLVMGWNPYTLNIEDIHRKELDAAKDRTKAKKKDLKKKNKKSKPTSNDMNPFAKPSKKNKKQGSSSWMDNPTAAKVININPSSGKDVLSGSGKFRCQNIAMSGAQCKNLTNNKSKRCYAHD